MTPLPLSARTGVVPADAAIPLLEGPLGALLLAGRDDTAGGPGFVVHDLAARALGSPVHTHTREDEWSFVLAGEVGVQIGDTTSVARPADLVLNWLIPGALILLTVRYSRRVVGETTGTQMTR